MTVIQAVTFLLTAAGGTAVVLIRDPRRQVFMLSLYGLLLGILFMLLAAPDVALSVIVVGSATPLMILATLRIVRKASS
ncbi:MAG TPA: hydrogenase subunit MbhD domain-containing protein [Nitrospiraceae bacterium]|nr:hydrogenase subunit MbhD domain-containing protein [Nitrospiraceae bacterium]